MSRGAQAAAAYRRIELESAVNSADKHELITLLFKALLVALEGCKVHHNHNNIAQVREYLGKASRILAGLQGSLDYDRGGDIAVNLGELYGYGIRQLFAANVNLDEKFDNVEEVRGLLAPVVEAWENMDLSKPTQLKQV